MTTILFTLTTLSTNTSDMHTTEAKQRFLNSPVIYKIFAEMVTFT